MVTWIVAEYNQSKSRESSPKIGRPKKELNHDLVEIIRSIIIFSNISGLPLSTPILRKKLKENSYIFSKWQLLHLLHMLGYYYGRSERQNMLHESPENVTFRNIYLQRQFENLQGGNKVPTKLEVFLDESYCYLGEVQKWRHFNF